MLTLKNERGIAAARVEFNGETRDPEQNRLIMQWLRLFPTPSLTPEQIKLLLEPVHSRELTRAGLTIK